MKLTPERFALLERGWLVVDARLTRNALRCLVCGTVIESTYQHDYRTCGCSNGTMVDGGLAYQRWGAVDPSKVESLAEFGPPPDLVALGSELLTVETECEQGLITADGYDHSWCGRTNAEPLPCTDGTRSKLLRPTGQPVPVVKGGTGVYVKRGSIMVLTNAQGLSQVFMYDADGHYSRIDLGPDPASLIGCWAFPVEVIR